MMISVRLILGAAAAVASTLVLAQSTLGELVDSGAKRMTKDQLESSLGGTKFTGGLRSGRATLNIELKADGTIAGSVTAQGHSAGTLGKWAVDETGKTCIDVRISTWNVTDKGCVFYYRLGEASYRTLNESEDRGTQMVKYVFAN